MVRPEVTEDVAVKPPEGFNIDDYSKPIFDMYEGHERVAVKLEVRNDLAKYIADRFGTKLETRQISDDRFEVTVEVSLSPTFYAWIFQFGGEIRILSPVKAVAEETVIAAIKNYSQYKDKDLHNLGRYAEMFKVSKQVRQYVEVLL